MADPNQLLVRIDATTEQLRRELRRADQQVGASAGRMDRSLRSVDQRMERVNRVARRAATGFGVLIGALAVRQLQRFGQEALNTAESIADVSAQTGIAAERLQGLRSAFDQNGGSAQQADAALQRFNRRIGLAAEGSGTAASAVERLGIRVRDVNGNMRASEAVFEDVVTAIAGLESSAERAAVASQFFGDRAGPMMAPLLAQGVTALDEYTQRLREAGVLMSDDMVQAGARASASLREVSDQIRAAFQTGILTSFADGTGNVEAALRELIPIARDLGQFLGDAFTSGARAARVMAENIEIVTTAVGSLVGARTLGRLGALVGGPKGGAIGVGVGAVVGALGGCAVVVREQEVPA